MLANLEVKAANKSVASKPELKNGTKRDKFKIGNMQKRQKSFESHIASKRADDAIKLINEEFKDECTTAGDAGVVDFDTAKTNQAPKQEVKKKFDKPMVRTPIVRAPQDEPAPEAKKAEVFSGTSF